MKYWCYYTDVVRYLERIEAGQSQKTAAPAYLIWQDDDGPSMIVGPGVEWYRGNGPPPDIDAITISAGRPPNRNTQSRKTWRAHSCVPCRHSWRHVLGPQARHNPDPTGAPAFHPPKKANKRSTNFPKPAQTCSPRNSVTSSQMIHLQRSDVKMSRFTANSILVNGMTAAECAR